MITLNMYVSGIWLIFYLCGFFATLNGKITEYTCDDDFEVHTKTNEATASDVWYSLVWPLFGMLIILKAFIYSINELIVILWLLVGVKYKKTNLYKYLKKLVDFK